MKSDLPAPDHASEFSFQGPVSEVSLWIIRNLPGQRSFDSKSLRQCLQVPLWKGGRSLRQLALTGNVLIYPDWSSIHVSLVQKPALFFFSDFPHRSPASKSLSGLQREKMLSLEAYFISEYDVANLCMEMQLKSHIFMGNSNVEFCKVGVRRGI